MKTRLPKGSYATRLIERRTVNTRTGPAVDLVFQVLQGEYAGEEIRTRVWLASQIARARDRSCTGDIIGVDVGYRVNHRGEKFWGITDFRAVRDRTTVAAAVAGLLADGPSLRSRHHARRGAAGWRWSTSLIAIPRRKVSRK